MRLFRANLLLTAVLFKEQLDAEMEEDAWIVEPVDPDDPFQDDDLWPAALQRKGGEYALLARMPVDPSLN